MNQTKSRSLQWLSLILRQLFLVGTFCVLDLWLRYKTRAIGLYSIKELAPNLLTFMWAVLFSSLVTLIPSRKWGRIAYGLVYYFYFIYTLVQFGVYLVLDRFVYVTDLFLAGEGADYADYVLEFVTPSLVCQLLVLIGFGVLGICFFPKKPAAAGKAAAVRGLAALLAGASVSFAGILGFVGLIVPHIMRRFVGSESRYLLPLCALGGAAFVTICDVIARVAFQPYEVPVGILMSFIGGPFFIWLLLKRKGGHSHG